MTGDLEIVAVEAKDIRWPTSLGGHGSDAMVTKEKSTFSSLFLIAANAFLFYSILIPITPVFTLRCEQKVVPMEMD